MSEKGGGTAAVKHEKIQSPTREPVLIYHLGLQVSLSICLLVRRVIRELHQDSSLFPSTAVISSSFILFKMCVCSTPSHERMAISNNTNTRAKRRKGPSRLNKGHCDIWAMVGLELIHVCTLFQIFATYYRRGWLFFCPYAQ